MTKNGAGNALSADGHAGINGTHAGHSGERETGYAMEPNHKNDQLSADLRELVQDVINPRFAELDDQVAAQGKATDGQIAKLDTKVGKLSKTVKDNARSMEAHVNSGLAAIRTEMQANMTTILAALNRK